MAMYIAYVAAGDSSVTPVLSEPPLASTPIGKYTEFVNLNGYCSPTQPIIFWDVGTLPAGLAVNTSTGLVTGTPIGPEGITAFNITGTGSGGLISNTVDMDWRIDPEIDPPTAPVLSVPNDRVSTINVAVAAMNLNQVTNPTKPIVTWSAAPLPAGLSLVTTTGIISGTPTTVEVATVSVSGVDGDGLTSNIVAFTWTVNATPIPPTIITNPSNLVDDVQVQIAPFALEDLMSPNKTMATWQAVGLPPGIGLNPNSGGVCSGTPTVIGSYVLDVVATDFEGVDSNTAQIGWVIQGTESPAPVTFPPNSWSHSSSKEMAAYNMAPHADEPCTWFIVSGFPQGISITSAGIISGRPQNNATYSPVVRCTSIATGLSSDITWSWVIF